MQKNEMLEYLEITEKYLLMFSTFTIKNLLLRKIKNVNYKGYVHDELKKKKKNSWDTHRTEAILDSFNFKRQEKPQETLANELKSSK